MHYLYDGFLLPYLRKLIFLAVALTGVAEPGYLHAAAPSFGDWTVVTTVPIVPAPSDPSTTDSTGFGATLTQVTDPALSYLTTSDSAWVAVTQTQVCDVSCSQDQGVHLYVYPQEITLPSTGTFTYISLNDTGMAGVAYNYNNLVNLVGTSAGLPKDIGPFVPGTHILTWQAIDNDGLILSATQTINIIPQVSFGPAMIVGEGGSVSVPVYLNGPAVSYPVEIPYAISGTATNPDDHDAIASTLTIASGTVGVITFNVVDDGITGETDEAVLLSLGTPVNAAPGVRSEQTITITEANLPPIIVLNVKQGINAGRIVAIDGGTVTVIATIHDPNTGDHHIIDWSGTENNLLVIGAVVENTFSFDPASLTPGVYKIKVKADDNAVPVATTSVDLLLRVTSEAPVQEVSNTISKNLIFGDLYDLAHELQLKWDAAQEDGNSLKTDPGLQIQSGNIAVAAGKDTSVTIEDISAYGDDGKPVVNADEGNVPGQIFDFEISGLSYPGQIAHVILPLQSPIPDLAVYRKYTLAAGWSDFVSDDYNSISSALLNDGGCPPVKSNLYEEGMNGLYQCIQLTLQDGGPNDADHSANGVIKDPGGVISVQSGEVIQESPSLVEDSPTTNTTDSESSTIANSPTTSATDSDISGGAGWVELISLIALAGFSIVRKKQGWLSLWE